MPRSPGLRFVNFCLYPVQNTNGSASLHVTYVDHPSSARYSCRDVEFLIPGMAFSVWPFRAGRLGLEPKDDALRRKQYVSCEHPESSKIVVSRYQTGKLSRL